MSADSDIQVWLETFGKAQPIVIVPYVKSDENTTLRYSIRAVKQSSGGRSVMGQNGTIIVAADKPTALSHMSLNRSWDDECRIDLILSERGSRDRRYHFECPK